MTRGKKIEVKERPAPHCVGLILKENMYKLVGREEEAAWERAGVGAGGSVEV